MALSVSQLMQKLYTITKDTPNEIFYKLDPVYESDVPVEKSQIINDNEVNLNNQIDVEFSAYSRTFPIGVLL